jgi:hypothetical protein
MTPEERRAAKEKELDTSLGDFDTTLRKEQARIAREREARRSATTASNSGSEEGSAGADEKDKGEKGEKSESGKSAEAGKARDGDLKSSKQENSKAGGASGQGKGPSTAPPEAGSGEDDDIVARQLREAAEKETDPELREKLWKEYIEYKKSAKH